MKVSFKPLTLKVLKIYLNGCSSPMLRDGGILTSKQLAMRKPLFHHLDKCRSTKEALLNLTREWFWEVGASGNVINHPNLLVLEISDLKPDIVAEKIMQYINKVDSDIKVGGKHE